MLFRHLCCSGICTVLAPVFVDHSVSCAVQANRARSKTVAKIRIEPHGTTIASLLLGGVLRLCRCLDH